MEEKALNFLNEIKQDFPNLRLKDIQNQVAIYEGEIAFNGNHHEKGVLSLEFEVQIAFPLDNSGIIPIAKEIGGRIPREIDYHVYAKGDMCLGPRLEVRRRFSNNPSLKGFIINLLAPFLYSFRYKEINGEYPFGELPHWHDGTYQSYKDEFKTNDGLLILSLLKILVENNYRGHMFCPCGSQIRLGNCHGKQIRKIKEIMKREDLLSDLIDCKRSYQEAGNKLPKNFVSKKLKSYHMKVTSKNTKK